MKLHSTAIDRITRLFDMWGGRANNSLLVQELLKVEFAVYHRKSDDTDVIVLKDDLDNQKQ